MADFYEEMAAMTADLLAPTSAGGLGQGEIVLSREGDPSPAPNPWEPVDTAERITEKLSGAVSGVSARMVGIEAGGTVILKSDRQLIAAVPHMGYQPGDQILIDGVPVMIIDVQKIPAAGITSAVKFIIRG